MKITELKQHTARENDAKFHPQYKNLQELLEVLRSRHLPDSLLKKINLEVEVLNAYTGTGKKFKKEIRRKQVSILKMLEKDAKLVVKDHYRNQWMALGMAVFGIPMGVAFSVSLGNYGFIGIGLPIGLAIGMAVGADMDKKTAKEGRQLNFNCGMDK